ncbi:MAG: Crp/Fnr family transcriptional regulator [Bacteroidales bacterium]|nr:Crp/Fnr family transcriptional regulator [Bacteroidales bacterium]
MEEILINYLSKYITITDELLLAIKESGFIKNFSKGTVLLSEGDLSNECYFILKGCVRCYYNKDGDEKTTDFYTEEQVVISSSYGKNKPSEHYLECVEDTVASVGSPELEAEMYHRFPQLESLARILGDVMMSKYQDTLAEYKIASPEERYLNLLKDRPDLMQRVPQHQIASYLGIKPESLSRIRKRLLNKQK